MDVLSGAQISKAGVPMYQSPSFGVEYSGTDFSHNAFHGMRYRPEMCISRNTEVGMGGWMVTWLSGAVLNLGVLNDRNVSVCSVCFWPRRARAVGRSR